MVCQSLKKYQDELQDEEQDTAAVTENKCQADSDSVGRLLGEMDKVRSWGPKILYFK